MQIYLAPKKRLIPLLTVSIIFLLAIIIALILSPKHLFLIFDIFIPIIIVVLIAIWWISRKQLSSLYLMMNNAYLRYRQGVVPRMIDYDTFVGNFMNENDPDRQHYRYWKHARHNTDTINRDFILRLLTDHKEDAEKAFSQDYTGHELPLEKFKELRELNKVSESETAHPKPSLKKQHTNKSNSISKPSKTDANRYTFESILTDKDIDLLVECINKLDIIETADMEEITSDDLKAFLNCESKPENESLVLIKNKEFAHLFKSLSSRRLIAAKWQAPIYKHNLLVTYTNKKYITRENLSVSVNKSVETPPDGAQISDRYISIIRDLHNKK